ncbi:MAG: HEAT repeat domain-containing protein [Deltaproteobacteria bacterium]|nr:HEAT repeat domain-containing protein [Deltaproteobacteria bacterium]
MNAFHISRLIRVTAITACLVLCACGPEPGTPEYVLVKIREGRVVGGKNLKLLKEAQLDEMAALLDDENAPAIARLQVLERMFQMDIADEFERFGHHIDDDEPQMRLRVIQWLSQRDDPASARLLMDRLAVEKELAVRANTVQALKQIGRGLSEPEPELIAVMIAHLKDPDAENRRLWASVLGGWHGQGVEAALIEALDDSNPKVRATAARSITGPVVRGLERVAPLFVSMLGNTQPEVRTAGISGLASCSYPRRFAFKGSKCAEKPLLNLLEAVPELPEAVAVFLERPDLTTKDRRLATELTNCIKQFTEADAGLSVPNPSGG